MTIKLYSAVYVYSSVIKKAKGVGAAGSVSTQEADCSLSSILKKTMLYKSLTMLLRRVLMAPGGYFFTVLRKRMICFHV